MSKDQKDHIRSLLELIPFGCAALVIGGLFLGTGVVLLGHEAEIPSKPSVSRANVSSILIAPPQSNVLLPELSVGSIAAKAAINPTLDGTPVHLHEAFADYRQFTAPEVSAKRWPVVRPRKAQSN